MYLEVRPPDKNILGASQFEDMWLADKVVCC